MTAEEIKKYLSAVFETELNIYVQENALIRMKNTYKALGNKKAIRKPAQRVSNTDVFGIMWFVGVVVGIIAAIIGAVYEFKTTSGIIAPVFEAVLGFVIYGIMGVIGGGLTLGSIIALSAKKSDQNKLDEQYKLDLAKYNQNIINDNNRVNKELIQKKALNNEIARMTSMLNQSKNNLREMYSYNVLNGDYQNIYAVSSIYGYFEKGRTRSLTFNEATGDQGAYNIYENEIRMNLIIRNTEEIMTKLDTVINNQYELANGLRSAQGKINSLCSDIGNFIYDTNRKLNEIEYCQSITAYNSEKTARELEFMNWMRVFDRV